MDIIEVLNWRYTAKEYDKTKKINKENLDKIKSILQLSASSTNLQPWHFLIAESDEAKERFAKSTKESFDFNTDKILNASHVIAFCSLTEVTDDHLSKVVNQEDKDGRFANEELKKNSDKGRKGFLKVHEYDSKDTKHWLEKQVYLNIGNFLVGVASLGIDATPMEGFDMRTFDKEFGLREKGFTSICLVCIGYHKDSDYNADLPKSRFPKEDIITLL